MKRRKKKPDCISKMLFISLHLHTPLIHTDTEEYATVQHGRDGGSPVLGRYLSSKDVRLLDKIGEGQFGDVHKGILYPDVSNLFVCPSVNCLAVSTSSVPAKCHKYQISRANFTLKQ